LKSNFPSWIFWHKTLDQQISGLTIPAWSTPVWLPLAANSQESFRYSDKYASWPAGEDGTPNTDTAGLPVRPASGKWILSAEWGTVKGTTTLSVDPAAISAIRFDIYPSTSDPQVAGTNFKQSLNMSNLEIETEDPFGNPRPVTSTTTITLTSDSGATASLKIGDNGYLTYEDVF
jgi:hypothetical protein